MITPLFIETVDDVIDLVNADHVVSVTTRRDPDDGSCNQLIGTITDGTVVVLDSAPIGYKPTTEWFVDILTASAMSQA